MCIETYKKEGLIGKKRKEQYRVLHLAPEGILYNKIATEKNIMYLLSDPNDERYPWTKVLRLFLPEDFRIFPDEYFDYIIHNHVLEHIPGKFKNHLKEFARILAQGGSMIFTIPGPVMGSLTEEGGESLTNEERFLKFGQEDHLKLFGRDLPGFLTETENMTFMFDDISDQERAQLSVKPNSSRVLIWRKEKIIHC